MDVFVWYRCPGDQSERVLAHARRCLARVAGVADVRGRLLRRREVADTWMEHYAIGDLDPARFAQLLAGACSDWPVDGPARHTECFEPLSADGPGTLLA